MQSQVCDIDRSQATRARTLRRASIGSVLATWARRTTSRLAGSHITMAMSGASWCRQRASQNPSVPTSSVSRIRSVVMSWALRILAIRPAVSPAPSVWMRAVLGAPGMETPTPQLWVLTSTATDRAPAVSPDGVTSLRVCGRVFSFQTRGTATGRRHGCPRPCRGQVNGLNAGLRRNRPRKGSWYLRCEEARVGASRSGHVSQNSHPVCRKFSALLTRHSHGPEQGRRLAR